MIGPAGAEGSFGAAPRFAGYNKQVAGARPEVQLQPPAVKLIDAGVSRFAVPASASATQSATPAGVVDVNMKCFPSRVHPPDAARRPVSPVAVIVRVRFVATSNTRTPIRPSEMLKNASRFASRVHCGNVMRDPAGTSIA